MSRNTVPIKAKVFPNTIMMGNGIIPSDFRSKVIVVSKQYNSYIYVYIFDMEDSSRDIFESVVKTDKVQTFRYKTDVLGLVEKELRTVMTITGEIPVILAGLCKIDPRLESQVLKLHDYLELIVEKEKKKPSHHIRRI